MVKLALLWHMHQPYYEDLATGEHILPWVRLHAIKDYWGMVAVLREFPRVRVTFNLVPSLVTQIQAFAENRARDRHLALGLKPAADLTPDEARWMVANGFHAPYAQMIGPYPRYAELHRFRTERRAFAVDELRDLQVWHKLAWMDPDVLSSDPRLVRLVAKGHGFAESDKTVLREVELELLSRVIPEYRDATARGQVELATSPFYHPILPLLCDSEAHLVAHPGAAQPRRRFSRPEDARLQIRRAVQFHAQVFGTRPAGMWPSEGSVSDAAVRLIGEAGLSWIATDEDILSRSLGQPMRPELLYRPYRPEGGPVMLFRDHALSDRIGFHYKTWEANAAAHDFLGRVRDAGRRFAAATGGEVATIAVILDGENAWEHYHGGGRPFLRALYSSLAQATDIQTVTMAEAAAAPARDLPRVFPGSWINGDFYIWIGHRDDHRAWDQLSAARATFDDRATGIDEDAKRRAFEEILIAEGSDWFWWYGDDHSSDHDPDFDDLFRRHLRNAYAALDAPVPADLFATNISTVSTERLSPTGHLSVTLDGRDSSYLEWVGAVAPALKRPGGAMHEVAAGTPLVTQLLVGTSPDALCLRLEGAGLIGCLAAGGSLAIIVMGASIRVVPIERAWMAVGSLIEIVVPFAAVLEGTDLGFAIQVQDSAGAVVETLPYGRCWLLRHESAVSWQA